MESCAQTEADKAAGEGHNKQNETQRGQDHFSSGNLEHAPHAHVLAMQRRFITGAPEETRGWSLTHQ